MIFPIWVWYVAICKRHVESHGHTLMKVQVVVDWILHFAFDWLCLKVETDNNEDILFELLFYYLSFTLSHVVEL